MAISAGDLVYMRGAMQRVTPHLNVMPKIVVGTAQINQANFSYPLGSLTLDATSFNGGITLSTVPVGSMVWIGTTAGAYDVLVTTVRANGSATELYINGMSYGDPGVAQGAVVALADDQYVTILANKPLWGQLSRMDTVTFEMYKQYNFEYTDENLNPDPICNIGPWQRVAWDSSGVSLTFTNAAVTDVKPASHAWGAATISSYAWSFRNSSYALNTGGSFNGGISNTEGVQIDFTSAGFYIVQCTITDSNSNTHTAETYVWLVDDSTLSDLDSWAIESGPDSTREGTTLRFNVYRDVAMTEIYPGAAVLYSEDQDYNGNSVTAGATVDSFSGYILEEVGRREPNRSQISFEAGGPSEVMKRISAASQWIEEVAGTPVDWTEITSTLSNPNGAAWYILHNHAPNYMKLFDVWLGDTSVSALRDSIWKFTQANIWGQLKEILPTQLNIGCAANGSLWIRYAPNLLDTADRSGVDNRMTWTAGDLRDSIEIRRTYRQKAGMVDAYAFSYDGTIDQPYWSRSPGDIQGQGAQQQVYNYMVVAATDAQNDLNTLAGHLFARDNSPTPNVKLLVMRNMDTADPARMQWHQLDIGAAYDPRGIGFSDVRCLPDRVTRRWYRTQASGQLLKRIEITMEPETTGVAGKTKQIPPSGDWWDEPDWDWPGWDFDDGISIADWRPFSYGRNQMAAFDKYSSITPYLHTTTDFLTPEADGGPTWTSTDLATLGSVTGLRDFAVDPFSYSAADGEVDGWIISNSAVWKIDDIFGTPTITQQQTFSFEQAKIEASFGEEGWVIVYGHTSTVGAEIYYTTDGGTNWNYKLITSNRDTNTQDIMALHMSSKIPGTAYAAAYTTASTVPTACELWKTTDYGANWSTVTSPAWTMGRSLGDTFHCFWHDNPNDLGCLYAYSLDGVLNSWRLYKTDADGTTVTDISPYDGSKYHGPGVYAYSAGVSRWIISTSPTNQDKIAFVGHSNSFGGATKGTWITRDGGDTWYDVLQDQSYQHQGIHIDGENDEWIYMWGDNTLHLSTDYGITFEDKSGSLGTGIDIAAICGGSA